MTKKRANDSDLEHLIAETSSPGKKSLPFNEEHHYASVDCISLTWTYLAFLIGYHKTGLFITLCFVAVLVASIFALTTTYEVPTITTYDIDVNVQSVLDNRIGKIDHWCLDGGDENCICSDPLEEQSRKEERGWMKAHKKNQATIKRAIASEKDLDVVFVGDSLIELWAGRMLGDDLDEKSDLYNVQRGFRRRFMTGNVTEFNGIPLGIAGDMSPNLLWRLRHGEMSGIDPKVWWLYIGIGDIAKARCSEEVVILGIWRIIEEIRKQKPSAMIVINGLIPITKVRGGQLTGKSHRYKRWANKDLWPSVEMINHALKTIADTRHGIKFFDPTPVFTKKGRKGDIIVKSYMNDPIHPSVLGYKKWADAITESLKSYLKNKN